MNTGIKRNPESSSKRKKFSEDDGKRYIGCVRYAGNDRVDGRDRLEECCRRIGRRLRNGWNPFGCIPRCTDPAGNDVTCESELIAIDGRKLTFRVEAKDERGTIGKGVHERFIVNDEKFQAKANQK